MEWITPETLRESGLAVIAIILAVLFYKTVVNHINHNTESNVKLTDAIEKLIHFLERKLG